MCRPRAQGARRPSPGGPVNTRTIAIIALVIAVVVLILLLM
jgi:hypothetical protein